MKLKWGALVVSGSGKVGGHVAARNRGGAYLRTKTTPLNPQSTYQIGVRNDFTANAQAWRGLTAAQREAWNQSNEDFKRTDQFGDLRTPSGFNLFMRLNNNLKAIGQSTISSPPSPAAVPAFTTFSLVADTTGGGLDLTFTPAIPASHSVIVYGTAGVSAGKKFVKNLYRQFDILINGDASPMDLAAEYIAKFGALPTIGKKVFIKMKIVVDASGLEGIPIEASSIAT